VPDRNPALPTLKEPVAVEGNLGPIDPPVSATRASVACLGLAGFAVGLVAVRNLQLPPIGEIVLILASTALPMLIVDIFVLEVHRRSTTGLDWARVPEFSLHRSAIKLLGLAATLAVLLFCYWLFPEYHRAQYTIVFEFFGATWPYFAVFSLIYIFIVDAYMSDPRDGYWQAGCFVIGRVEQVDKIVFGQYCLGWLMKGFFIPFVISLFVADINAIFDSGLLRGEMGFRRFYEFGYVLLYGIDTTFGTLGYLLTTRLADAHIRSTETTLLGWLVALACYPPFWPFVADRFLPYDSHAVFWGSWLEAFPRLYEIWGAVILCCVAIYASATVIFGCRFSNLTHRGILTNGPYRLSKHPAYLSKNLSYWLIAVPFISTTGSADALRGCLMLGLVNVIYFIRARTEERHLSRDPAYVTYALWINEHGALKWLGRAAPILRYVPPSPGLAQES